MKQHGNNIWYEVHEGFIRVFHKYNKPVPVISKHVEQFTREEFEKFAEACRESEARMLKTKSMSKTVTSR